MNQPNPNTPSQPNQEHGSLDPAKLPRIGVPAVLGMLLVFLLLLAALFLVGWFPRLHEAKLLEQDVAANKNAAPVVDVAKPRQQDSTSDLILPGDTFAYQETAIFPRANGYLKSQLVDIGDHVKAGQLLAEIDSPEVDADLSQAKAALAQAQATLVQTKASVVKAAADRQLAQSTYDRYAGYAKSGGVTELQLEEKLTGIDQAKAAYDVAVAAANAADASVAAAQASVQRFTDMQNFEKIVAPFTGTITARTYDLGALLSATDTGAGRQMLRITQDDPLRVFVNVPQAFINMVKDGQTADLTVRNYPGRKFTGKVVRSTEEVDQATRTQRFEVDVPNPDHALVAGMYGQMQFLLHPEKPLLTVPSSALLFEADGLKVAVVRNGQAHYQHIAVGRDLGNKVEVSEGLNPEDDVVVNPGERLGEGVEVQVAPPRTAAAPDAPPKPKLIPTPEQAAR